MSIRTIIPDYARPHALMVPHCNVDIRPLLEEIAAAAARRIGVILLSDDPNSTRRFVDTQEAPDRFSIVAAEYDTPWIRDRAPVAVKDGGTVRWVLPRLPPENRPLDDRLFASISAREVEPAPLIAAQGNLVAGPRGIALSTRRILRENGFSEPSQLEAHAPVFGIRKWLVFDRFPEEPTGHADLHVRFLRSDLMAVAWHPCDSDVQERALAIERNVQLSVPGVRIIRIPLARDGARYASLANWIQIGRDLLVPSYELTTDSDIRAATSVLQQSGFRVEVISAPTLDLGGSLHCLTASVFV